MEEREQNDITISKIKIIIYKENKKKHFYWGLYFQFSKICTMLFYQCDKVYVIIL